MAVTINGTSGLTLESNGSRITGDFSNTSILSRTMFQTRITDDVTNVFAIPNGTGTAATFGVLNSNTANYSAGYMQMTSSAMYLVSDKGGTGSYQPLVFNTGGVERMRIDTSGNVTIANNISAAGTVSMGYSFKRNRIINGNMLIDQRNAGALISPAVAGYVTDRWYYYQTQTSKGTIGQNAGAVTPPAGYTNYLGFTSTSSYSVTATDIFYIGQFIEGYNVADLAWGTSSAATVTLSFWVRSSLTGTFGAVVTNSAANRTYPFTYTISSANTWEKKTVTVAGDTTGTWLTTNGRGLCVDFSLGVGSTYSGTAGAWTGTSFITSVTGATSVVGTSGATFYITGVQLETGTVATPYEIQIFSDQLLQCQRYYEIVGASVYVSYYVSSVPIIGQYSYKAVKRVQPTGSGIISGNFNTISVTYGGLYWVNLGYTGTTVSDVAFTGNGYVSAEL
jgi:hypothetical protein